MSHRLTNEELDEQFEQFLKESVSDESVDLGGGRGDQRPSVLDFLGRGGRRPAPKKTPVGATVTWLDEDDSEEDRGRAAKHRFIKVKKSHAEDAEDAESGPRTSPPPQAATAGPPVKPVPKPRSRALPPGGDVAVALEEPPQTRQRSSEDDSPSRSQRSPAAYESPRSASGESPPPPDETSSPDAPLADSSASHSPDSSSGGAGDGSLASGKSFRKSLRRSQTIQEEDDEPVGARGVTEEEGVGADLTRADLTRDSLEAEDSAMALRPGGRLAGLGMDTLEEEEEKARFFAQLEGGASSTIDYSRLNRELDSTSSTTGTTLRRTQPAVEQDDDPRQDSVSPAVAGSSPHYSEDFEDEGSAQEAQEKKPERSPSADKVSLRDSLDSSGGARGPKTDSDDRKEDPAASPDTGAVLPSQSYGQSAGSEMEALQEAYRQISHSAEEQGPEEEQGPQEEPPARRQRSSDRTPPSSPQRSRGTLRPASSTAESDLPTVEELLKPIRPETEHLRGFTLQPASGAELHPDGAEGPLETRSPRGSPERAAQPGPAARKGGAGRADLPVRDQTWSVREEVERLMQDQDSPSPVPSARPGRAKKHQCLPQAPRGSTVASSSPPSARRPGVAPVRGRRGERRFTLASTFTAPSRAEAKPPPPLTQRKPVRQTLPRSPSPKHTEKSPDPLKVSSELIASVQSFAAFLQHQADADGRRVTTAPQETTGPQESTRSDKNSEAREEQPLVDRLRAQLAQKDRELQLREEELLQQHREELNSVRQENYILQSKLRSAEESGQKRRWGDATDPVTEDKLRLIEKEVQEQETLIQGYQQENQKLYLQMKAQQAAGKDNEEAMFSENQSLLSELVFTREQLSQTSRPVGKVCSLDHTRRITELLAQMHTIQRNEAQLVEETRRLKQDKQALDVDLQLMKKERDLAKAHAVSSSGDKSFEMRVQGDRHREETDALKKRLQWYAENQELLDRDAARLRDATAETHRLKEQMEKLQTDVGRRGSRQQDKTKERAADARRIQDLERQVKELEDIQRRRHPNSLPALMYAAASTCTPEDQDAAKTSPPNRVTALLERRVQRLEAELESHDEEAKRSLRAMEQQYQRIKLQYEQQISELEQQLAQKHHPDPAGVEPGASRVGALEEECVRLKEEHRHREEALQEQVQSLQNQLTSKAPAPDPLAPPRSPSTRHQRQAEASAAVRIERLNQELTAKTRAVQDLTRTVDRLQRERRDVLCGPSPRREPRPGGGGGGGGAGGGAGGGGGGGGGGGAETFPPTRDEKDYQPTAFSGSHITEVLQENEGLRESLARLRLERERERAAPQAAQVELCRLQESSAEQLSSLRAEHLRELDRLRVAYALEHSSSKVATLCNQVATQEVALQRLRDQLTELQKTRDALTVSRVREETLHNQLTRLLGDLKEAQDAHSPELKHFLSLERKIHSMELRHSQRETELQQVIGQTRQVVEAEQRSELERWRLLAQGRSRELEAFRLELDAILDVLRELQRQGVVIPAPSRPPTVKAHPFTWKS